MFMLQMKRSRLQMNRSTIQWVRQPNFYYHNTYQSNKLRQKARTETSYVWARHTHTQQLVQGASPNLFSATTSHASIMLHTYRNHQKPIPLSLKGSHLSLSIQSNPRKVYRINPTKSKHPIRSKAHQGISIPKLFLN